jgi:hypothetical protein
VTWRVAAASAAGTSHIAVGKPCEDSCRVRVLAAKRGPLLSMFVADGAGSAEHGGEGAALAVDAAARSLETRLANVHLKADDALMRSIVAEVQSDLVATSEARDRSPRDFACTFLAVLATSETTAVAQIGDGGIVLDVGAGLGLALEPMTGEYANTTRFVTDEDALEAVSVRTYAALALRVAAFSDGLQRLAIDMATLTPHAPLFEKLFATLRAASPEQEAELAPALARFLDRPDINERTDDDKTLALAVMLS